MCGGFLIALDNQFLACSPAPQGPSDWVQILRKKLLVGSSIMVESQFLNIRFSQVESLQIMRRGNRNKVMRFYQIFKLEQLEAKAVME